MFSKYKSYIIQILIALAVGGLSALAVMGNFSVYDEVIKPALAPPPIVFPIVWSILYILMGISSGIVHKTESRVPFIYWLQLFVNFLWPIIFFNMQAYLFALIWLVLLWVLIIAMIVEFYKINKIAAFLQIPYLLWATFAAYLNFFIWLYSRY
ncbi:MAG: tryptophan-rich sensory protein [Clostridia bacterium]|nr:tryptophan-rich sensory protein [Clostridia bacterium]